MSRFSPLDFQQKAIEDLTEVFLKLWEKPDTQRHLVFKSPTGSGKTFVVTHLIHSLNSLPNWDYDKSFIWITFSDNLAMQSKDKFKQYFNTNLENNLLTIEDFKQGKLQKNDILFINWQKLVASKKENRLLRRPDEEIFLKEQGYYFEDLIENTHKEGREIILIIDESHKNRDTELAQDVINVVNPKIIFNFTATPKEKEELEARRNKAFVEVEREDVVVAGLIKEKIAVQTDEDLHKFPGRDLDELLIDLAIEKKKELDAEFKKLGKNINPLILIQLPNDDSKLKDAGHKTKEQIVLDYLTKKRIDVDNKVALWFDKKEKNMEFITHNECDIDFMLFKQAAGTGWDCPRAHILVMFREINSPTFYTQTVGRILRSAEPNKKEDYKDSPDLRTGYLFTNYRRNEISIPDKSDSNKPFIYTSKRKEGITNIENLISDFVSRVDYGDLGHAFNFQMSFLKSFNNYFGIEENEHLATTRPKLEAKGIELQPKLTNNLIVNAVFSDYDKLNLDFSKSGKDAEYEMSRNDVEKLFNFLCYKLLSEQNDVEAKVSNVSRSWSPLKSALRVWFKRVLDIDSNYYYRVFIADINREHGSIFRPALTKALKDYYPKKEEFIEKRKKEIEIAEAPKFEIKAEYNYTEDFAEISKEEGTSNLSAVQPFYLRKEYKGRQNELKFINYLEQKAEKIEWWFKNGEGSKEYYCIKYYNTTKREESLFFPDWIIKFKDGRIGIFDTKSGITAANTEGRADALANKTIELNTDGGNFVGGIAVLENNQWYYFTDEKTATKLFADRVSDHTAEYNGRPIYDYTPGKLNKNWKLLESIF